MVNLATSVLSALSLVVIVSGITVSYDNSYDKSTTPLNQVACSDGSNGFLTKDYTTYGSLRNFPNIGGAAAVSTWNSAACGTCWELTYKNKSMNVLAIDHADEGFNISEEGMNHLTNGKAEQLGQVDAVVKQLHTSACNLEDV